MAIKLFDKTLTPTDTTKRLSVPTKALPLLVGSCEGHSVNLRVMFEKAECWISCTKRRNGYKKPVLSKGWVPFVRRNRLKVGDRVFFYKEAAATDGCSSYRIKVKRSVTNNSPTAQREDRVKKELDPDAGSCCYNSAGNDGVAAVSGIKEMTETADSSFSAGVAEDYSLRPERLQQGCLNLGSPAVSGYASAGFPAESFLEGPPSLSSGGPGGSLVSGSPITIPWDGPEVPGSEASNWADETEGPNLELSLAPPAVEEVADVMELKCIDFLGIF